MIKFNPLWYFVAAATMQLSYILYLSFAPGDSLNPQDFVYLDPSEFPDNLKDLAYKLKYNRIMEMVVSPNGSLLPSDFDRPKSVLIRYPLSDITVYVTTYKDQQLPAYEVISILFAIKQVRIDPLSTTELSSVENNTTGSVNLDEVPTIAEIKNRAVRVFENPVRDRKEVSSFLKGHSGVYIWYLKLNGKFYVGSSVDLRYRFYDYFSKSYVYKSGNSIMANAILKYGLGAFEFIVLEFTDRAETLSREQFYIDTLKPEYNTLKIAGCTLGFVPSVETREKLSKAASGRVHSLETIAKISESQKNNKNNPGLAISVLDLETSVRTEYVNLTEAAKVLDFSRSTLSMGLKKSDRAPFVVKGRYEVSLKPS